ncbi:Outer membrane protein assembly factor BamB [uncultured archaeon]|nr:Outer membrane protein assembly factor BamB [uncultured archaeon]
MKLLRQPFLRRGQIGRIYGRLRDKAAFASIIALIVSLSLNCAAQTSENDTNERILTASWPMYRHDAGRTGYLRPLISDIDPRNYTLLWRRQLGGPVYSSPAVVDLNGDGALDVVVGCDDGFVYAYDSDGILLWKTQTQGRVRSSPAVWNFTDVGWSTVVVGSEDGRVYAIDGRNGSVEWSYQTGGNIVSSPLIQNLDETPEYEIVIGSEDHYVYAFDYLGKLIWKYQTQDAIESSPAVIDFDNDGKNDITVGGMDTLLYILSTPPYRIWSYNILGGVHATPAMTGNIVYIGSMNDRLFALYKTDLGSAGNRRVCDATGCRRESITMTGLGQIWNVSMGEIYGSAAVADIDNDGWEEVIVGSKDKSLYIINASSGGIRYRYTTSRPISTSPALADINHDGSLEILFTNDNGILYLINSTAYTLWTYDLGGQGKSDPVFADIEGDETAEIVTASTDGGLYVFEYQWAVLRRRGFSSYMKALRLYENGTVADVAALLNDAETTFKDANYRKGSYLIQDFRNRIVADGMMADARSAYLSGNYRLSSDLLSNASFIYASIGRVEDVDKAQNLLTQIEGDTYLMEADFYLGEGDIENSSMYAREALNRYAKIKDTEGVFNVQMFLDRIARRSTIEASYSIAKQYIKDGNLTDGLIQTLRNVEKGYRDTNFTAEAEEAGLTLNRVNAGFAAKKAKEAFDDTEYDDASDYAGQAAESYRSLGMTSEAAQMDNLRSRAQGFSQATKDLDEARLYFTATDFRTAADSSLKARDMFLNLSEPDLAAEAETIYNKSISRAPVGNESSEKQIIMIAVAIVAVVFLVFFLLVQRARKIWHRFSFGSAGVGEEVPVYAVEGERAGSSAIMRAWMSRERRIGKPWAFYFGLSRAGAPLGLQHLQEGYLPLGESLMTRARRYYRAVRMQEDLRKATAGVKVKIKRTKHPADKHEAHSAVEVHDLPAAVVPSSASHKPAVAASPQPVNIRKPPAQAAVKPEPIKVAPQMPQTAPQVKAPSLPVEVKTQPPAAYTPTNQKQPDVLPASAVEKKRGLLSRIFPRKKSSIEKAAATLKPRQQPVSATPQPAAANKPPESVKPAFRTPELAVNPPAAKPPKPPEEVKKQPPATVPIVASPVVSPQPTLPAAEAAPPYVKKSFLSRILPHRKQKPTPTAPLPPVNLIAPPTKQQATKPTAPAIEPKAALKKSEPSVPSLSPQSKPAAPEQILPEKTKRSPITTSAMPAPTKQPTLSAAAQPAAASPIASVSRKKGFLSRIFSGGEDSTHRVLEHFRQLERRDAEKAATEFRMDTKAAIESDKEGLPKVTVTPSRTQSYAGRPPQAVKTAPPQPAAPTQSPKQMPPVSAVKTPVVIQQPQVPAAAQPQPQSMEQPAFIVQQPPIVVTWNHSHAAPAALPDKPASTAPQQQTSVEGRIAPSDAPAQIKAQQNQSETTPKFTSQPENIALVRQIEESMAQQTPQPTPETQQPTLNAPAATTALIPQTTPASAQIYAQQQNTNLSTAEQPQKTATATLPLPEKEDLKGRKESSPPKKGQHAPWYGYDEDEAFP